MRVLDCRLWNGTRMSTPLLSWAGSDDGENATGSRIDNLQFDYLSNSLGARKAKFSVSPPLGVANKTISLTNN